MSTAGILLVAGVLALGLALVLGAVRPGISRR